MTDPSSATAQLPSEAREALGRAPRGQGPGWRKQGDQRQQFVRQLRGVFVGRGWREWSLELGGIIIPELGIGSQDKGHRPGIPQDHGRVWTGREDSSFLIAYHHNLSPKEKKQKKRRGKKFHRICVNRAMYHLLSLIAC